MVYFGLSHLPPDSLASSYLRRSTPALAFVLYAQVGLPREQQMGTSHQICTSSTVLSGAFPCRQKSCKSYCRFAWPGSGKNGKRCFPAVGPCFGKRNVHQERGDSNIPSLDQQLPQDAANLGTIRGVGGACSMLLAVPSPLYRGHLSSIRKLPSALVLFAGICFVPGQETRLITRSGGSLGSIDTCALAALSLKKQLG